MREKKGATAKYILLALVFLVVVAAILVGYFLWHSPGEQTQPTAAQTTAIPTTEEPTEPPVVWDSGYLASVEETIIAYNEAGEERVYYRGQPMEFAVVGMETVIRVDGEEVRFKDKIRPVKMISDAVVHHTRYVRTTVNLRGQDGSLLDILVEKGDAVEVRGCDTIEAEGQVHMYRVALDGYTGFIPDSYLVMTQEEALQNYDDGNYATHVERGNRYGGGDAADLDYFPRQKGEIPGNPMPEECRTLYLTTASIRNVDDYLAVAKDSGINAFVVDIVDGGAVGYAGEVMTQYCPTGAAAARNAVEEYQQAIAKLKDAGYYVIGRITTFNDSYFVKDHPEYAIVDLQGSPLRLSGEYWPSPYSREAWQYKVELALEAVELMGFNEIQFDYVRFPDSTGRYESAGTIDFRNDYGESKAQAIQRFLMYATDRIHEAGAYVSADVYGESAYTYVTAYGQYWPAISNVVDVISGMPYPDHFSASGDWKPWEHPYSTLHSWGKQVTARQGEIPTPAAVRTWIQAYNAIREPYNSYGPVEVADQIKGLRDAGCTGGYMTWNPNASLEKYRWLLPAFAPPEGA